MQGSFISEMEWAPFKSLFWNTNYSMAKLTISITKGVSFWERLCDLDILNYDSGKKC